MNEFSWIELLGMLAGVQTTLAFLPQALRVFRTKSVHDISLATFCLFTTGVASWLVYGLLIGSLPVVVANLITFLLAAAILVMKIRYARRPHCRIERAQ